MRFLILFLTTFLAINFSMAQITMQNKEEGILIKENDQDVFFFQIEPKSKNGEYTRNNYIHPLWGPDGAVLTEDFPDDHLHHRGIFWTWHQVWIGNERIGDPWEIKDFEQEISEVEFISQQDGIGLLKTEVYWKSDKWQKSGVKVPYIKEKTKITVHSKTRNYRKIDFEISLLALETGLRIGGSEDEKGYSGFSIRMKLPEDVKFTGPDGTVIPKVTAVKSDGYINISGSVGLNDNHGGIVMVDHPENPDYPQQWILRAKNSMQNAAWPGRETVSLSVADPVVLKYSLVIYSGKLSNKRIEKIIKNKSK